jgi:hypothetical protein
VAQNSKFKEKGKHKARPLNDNRDRDGTTSTSGIKDEVQRKCKYDISNSD